MPILTANQPKTPHFRKWAPVIPLSLLTLFLILAFSPLHFRWRGVDYYAGGGIATGVTAATLGEGVRTTTSFSWNTLAGFDPSHCQKATAWSTRFGPCYYLILGVEQTNRPYIGVITPELKRLMVKTPSANTAVESISPGSPTR